MKNLYQTPEKELFEKYNTPEKMAKIELEELEKDVYKDPKKWTTMRSLKRF